MRTHMLDAAVANTAVGRNTNHIEISLRLAKEHAIHKVQSERSQRFLRWVVPEGRPQGRPSSFRLSNAETVSSSQTHVPPSCLSFLGLDDSRVNHIRLSAQGSRLIFSRLAFSKRCKREEMKHGTNAQSELSINCSAASY